MRMKRKRKGKREMGNDVTSSALLYSHGVLGVDIPTARIAYRERKSKMVYRF